MNKRILHSVLAAVLARETQNAALEHSGRRITYRDLNRLSDVLAHRLQGEGVKPGCVVALPMPASAEYVVALIATVKVGGIFMPMDPAYPQARIRRIMRAADPHLVLGRAVDVDLVRTIASLTPRKPGILIVDLDDMGEAGGAPLPIVVGEDDTGYLIHTSGSTGEPKLIAGRNKGISHFVHWEVAEFGLDASVRASFLAPPSFDVSLREIFVPLLAGGTLVIPDPDIRADAHRLVDWLRDQHVTLLHCVPSLFRLLTRVLQGEADPAMPDLRLVALAGEPLYGADVAAWRAAAGDGAALVNLYGPSETTLAKAFHRIDGETYAASAIVPIGKPIANTALLLLRDGRLCDIGEIGEIHIRTAFASNGYHAAPELTREAFVANPLADGADDLIYRTGDLGRYRADRSVEFVGRKDRQVKVDGVRVELLDVEGVLRSCPGVSEAAVQAFRMADGGTRLAGYFTGEAGEAVVRDHATAHLPRGMVPTHLCRLEAFPRNLNGKIDRKALPRPEAMLNSAGMFTPPDGPVEITLARLWAEALGVERVGVTSPWLQIGGNSLRAIGVIGRINQALGTDLTIRDFFEQGTVRNLARLLAQRRASTAAPLLRAPEAPDYPLTDAQRRLWVLSRLPGRQTLYNNVEWLEVSGPLDRDALTAGFQALIDRHEALRTVFVERDGEPRQCITPPWRFELMPEEMTGAGARESIAAALAQETARPFDLASEPLLRARILREAPERHHLLINMHHIVCDGWSMAILVRELAAAYNAARDGRPLVLPVAEYRLRDYAAFCTDPAREATLVPHRDYWASRLTDAADRSVIPADPAAPDVAAERARRLGIDLVPESVARFRRLMTESESTPFAGIAAVLAMLMYRYGGRETVLFGMPVSGRGREELSSVVGFFVNTLPFALRVGGELTFADLLERARAAVTELNEHQDYPFDRLVAEHAVKGERDISRNPLFEVMLAMEPAAGDLGFTGLSVVEHEAEETAARYDLSLRMADDGERLRLIIEYRESLYGPAMMTRLARHFANLLGAAVEAPRARLAELQMLDDAELQAVTGLAEGPVRSMPQAAIHELFAAQAARTPEATALVYDLDEGRGGIDFRTLDERANRLAQVLREEFAVCPGDVVAVLLERSPAWTTALLAVLKAGAVYMPLDPRHPPARLDEMLADAQPRALVSTPGLVAALATPPPLCEPDAADGTLAKPPAVTVTPDDPAYLIYTSGSTGTPKGVLIHHRAFANMILDQIAALGVGPGDRVLHFMSPAFDVSLFEVFLALLSGGTLALGDRAQTATPDGFAGVLQRLDVTVATLTPGFLGSLCELPLPTLRLLIVGGEPPNAADIALRLRAGIRCVNAYGPTETAVNASLYEFDPGQPPVAPVPLGRPTANTALLVVAPDMSPLPLGLPGELAIAGAGVGRGYFHRPAATAKAFCRDAAGRPVFRTGDLVRRGQDGQLIFLGRLDQQVKIRGHRVEIGEVEAAIRRLEGVQDVRVLTRRIGAELALVAYWLGAPPVPQDLQAELKRSLPDYEVPRFFVRLDAFPLNANGKLDVARLPEPGAVPHAAGGAPRTPDEATLVDLWRETLGGVAVERDSDFFELGGHSLAANRLVLKASRALGVRVGIEDVYAAASPARLAARLLSRRTDIAGRVAEIPRLPEGVDAPLSPMQRRLWVIECLGQAGATYHIAGLMRLTGALEPVALRAAFDDVVTRHAVLRTRIVAGDGEPRQLVDPPGRQVLSPVDARGWAADRLEADIAAAAERGFALASDWPLRATLYVVAPGEWRLLVVMHHIAADGWSMPILERDLAAAYRARCRGTAPGWAAQPLQYRDVAAWLAGQLAGNAFAASSEYWCRRFAGELPVLDLPTDRPRPPVRRFRGETRDYPLPDDAIKALDGLAAELGATRFAVLLAAVQTMLYRLSGQEDLIVGVPVAGRIHPASEEMIGFFVNTLPLRDRLQPAESFAELVGRARDVLSEALQHQAFPFDRLVDELDLKRDTSRSPLFDVMVSLNDLPRQPVTLDGVEGADLPLARSGARCDLSWMFDLADSGGVLHIEYDTDLFDGRRIDDLASRLWQLLSAARAHPSTALVELDWLRAGERGWLIGELNRGDRPLPDLTVVQLIEAQAAAHPDAPAVITDTEHWTYAQLNQAANRLARSLLPLVGDAAASGPPVAMLAEPGPAMAVGMLAILKCGASYLPIEPDSPPERLSWLLADSGARLLLHDPSLPASSLPPDVRSLALDMPHDGAADNLPPRAGPRDLIYVMYTSGSTGRPKGVMIEHRSVVRLVHQSNYFRADAGDHVLQLSNYAFDGATFDFYAALANGLPLCVPDRDTVHDPLRLADFISRHGVNVTFITTALFNQLVDAAPQVLSGFRRIYFGGQEASLPHARRALALTRPDALVHVYGPTEATTFATWHAVSADDIAAPSLRLPIGQPVSHTQTYVLDANRQLLPLGVPGELYLGGAGLARGYLGQAALTAERFVPSPFDDGERLYRTGDLCQRRADGAIEFLGRLDGQVKVRGYRVELGEVEQRLLAHPGIGTAHVMARRNSAANLELVAYFTAAAADVPSAAELRGHLERWLPDYMIPAHMVALPALPLNRNGKVDRAALPPPGKAVAARAASTGPRNAAERVLWSVWHDVLGREDFGVRDNYFMLGGDSIQAIRIAVKLRDAGHVLNVVDLMRTPTIEALAPLLQSSTPPPRALAAAPVGDAPLTPIQCWFMENAFEAPHHFNQSALLSLPARGDAAALERALELLVQRHDALRLVFGLCADGAWQRVLPPGEGTRMATLDLRADGDSTRMAAHIQELQRSLRTETGPLMRAALYRQADGDRLFLTVHHWAIDGVSWRILLDDLQALLAPTANGTTDHSFPPPSSAFALWAARLAQATRDGKFAAERDHWLQAITAPAARLPVLPGADGRPAPLKARKTMTLGLSAEDTDGILGGCHVAYNTAGDELILAAWVRALTRTLGQPSCRMVLEGHGRDRLFDDIDLSRTIGWFTAMYPVRFTVTGDGLATQIREVKETRRQVPNHGVGWGALRYLARDPELCAASRPEIGFNYLGRFEDSAADSLHGHATGDELSPETRLPHGLDLSASVCAGRLEIRLVCDTGRHPVDFFERLHEELRRALREVIDHCLTPDAGGLSPSDVDLDGIDIAALDAIVDGLGRTGAGADSFGTGVGK